eukprot:SM000150S01727  [mRNA]  locus=s150:231274:233453:+ [translate_table: standard]
MVLLLWRLASTLYRLPYLADVGATDNVKLDLLRHCLHLHLVLRPSRLDLNPQRSHEDAVVRCGIGLQRGVVSQCYELEWNGKEWKSPPDGLPGAAVDCSPPATLPCSSEEVAGLKDGGDRLPKLPCNFSALALPLPPLRKLLLLCSTLGGPCLLSITGRCLRRPLLRTTLPVMDLLRWSLTFLGRLATDSWPFTAACPAFDQDKPTPGRCAWTCTAADGGLKCAPSWLMALALHDALQMPDVVFHPAI